MRLSELLMAVKVVAVHCYRRPLCCPRDRHRDSVTNRYGRMVYYCVDCTRQVELGPVFPSHVCHAHPWREA